MQKIGKYEVLAELGQGSMGAVYRARDTVLDRLVALKTISPGVLTKQEGLARFQREAQAAARLQHPNIVIIYELGETQGTHFIAMELLDGMDFGQALAPPDRFTLDQKLRMVLQICEALDYAHKRGVIHRDVKPANVRVLRDLTVKLVDFGIAHVQDSNLTRTGIVLGTPSYVAPEVLAGGRVDHRADMWAVGVMLYEVLAGRRPWVSPTFLSLAYRIINEPLPPLDDRTLALWPGVADVVSKALAKRPDDRFRDLAEMSMALQGVLGAPRATPAPSSDARAKAWRALFEEAHRERAAGDLEKALVAARRAQALDPARPDSAALVDELEEQLQTAPTISRGPLELPAVAAPVSAATPSPPTAPVRAERPGLRARASGGVSPGPSTPVPPTTRMPSVAVPAPAAGSPTRDVRPAASSWREIATFGEPPAAQAAALSPVRDLLAIAGADGALRLWDLGTRTAAGVLRTAVHGRSGHDARPLTLAFSPDGTLLASGHVDGTVHLWDVARGEEAEVRLRHDEAVGALTFSPDGALLASGAADATLKLWDVGAALSGEARRLLHRQPAGVTALAYAAGGDSLVAGLSNHALRVLDAATGRLLATVRGPEGAVHLLALAPDARRVAVGSQDRTVRVFDLEARTAMVPVSVERKPPVALAFSPDGTWMASVCLDNAVRLHGLDPAVPLATLRGSAEEAFAGVALFADGARIAGVLADGRIRTWGPA